MTDYLRDRIAAVLSQHDVNLPDKVADAVICEITSTHLMLPCRNCGCPLVRDWSAIDDKTENVSHD